MLPKMYDRKPSDLLFTALVTGLFILSLSGVVFASPDDRATHEPAVEQAPVIDEADQQIADTDPSAVTEFRAVLEPHGVWVEDATYGLVWIPSQSVVGADFVPYETGGSWGLTDEGDWIWISDYEWGWVTFHYGRWVWIPGTGWAWIAGRRYAPAWVVWRVGGPGYAYVGWAPMPPEYYWSGGVAVAFWISPPPYYVYCESRYVFAHHHHHVVHGPRAAAIAARTRPYRPAGASRHAAHPTRGPSPSEIGVPADAVPRTPAKPEPRARSSAAGGGKTASLQRLPAAAAPGRRGQGAEGSTLPGVSGATYRGSPSSDLAASRRGRSLAPGASQSSPSRGWSSRTLGSSRPDEGRARYGRYRTDRSGAAYDRGIQPTPTVRPQPSSRPSVGTGSSSRPVHRAQPAPQPTYRTQPSSRPTYRSPESSQPTYRSQDTSQPTYRSSGSSQPTYRSPATSRPIDRAPATGGQGGQGSYKKNDSRGRGKGRDAATPRGGRRSR